MVSVADTINWVWNNSVTREISKYPKSIANVFWNTKPSDCKEIATKIVEVLPPSIMIIPSSSRLFVRLAGLSGALAVGMGAYGAHVFYHRQGSEELKTVYETANRYHFMHSLALLGAPLCKRPKLVGTLLVVGSVVFSGTCYYYALTGSRHVRQYTPYGGMMLIAGWLAMVL